ncbi:alpha/beta hydrolase [Streptomyces sp. SID3212]|uniref:alpha/beta fold hydrolase n=1 Tax=Streptomyces sp. SID3212 TaxID=2690259 RepID=UPI00136F1EE2|nr:alpha/beta hydrolase [Streptomyces sp. SID3212]MYV54065.1 alpha/beta fold hydrolase [Streptomyces sp. SID3212]
MSTYAADAAENLTVEGPSARFTYRRMGPRGGTPLVLLVRFRGTIDWWDPEFLDLLAADHDVILFDNVGIGHTTGRPRDSAEGFADGAVEFIQALGLPRVDLLGWSLGGIVAQYVVRRSPQLVRRLIVAGSSPGAPVPGAPAMSDRVRAIMEKPGGGAPDDVLYLFFPETDAGRAAGRQHLAHVSTRLRAGGPAISDEAARGQLTAVAKLQSVPFDQVRSHLESIKQPVLYANGVQDVMIPALASYVAVQHLDSAVLVLYSDAGHGFLFQHAEAFAAQVTNFLAG